MLWMGEMIIFALNASVAKSLVSQVCFVMQRWGYKSNVLVVSVRFVVLEGFRPFIQQ